MAGRGREAAGDKKPSAANGAGERMVPGEERYGGAASKPLGRKPPSPGNNNYSPSLGCFQVKRRGWCKRFGGGYIHFLKRKNMKEPSITSSMMSTMTQNP